VEGAIETCTHLFSFYPNLSILGTTIYTPTNQPWFTGGRFIKAWGQILEQGIAFEDSDVDYQICDWVSGCSLILNLKQFKICPQFDPTYFLYYEDVDFCLRYQQQGHLIAITPKIQVTHHPSSITNQNLSKKFQYSTYGYLLTLHRYSPWPVLLLRLLRVGLYALLLWPCRPDISQGKLTGLWQYLTRD
jgi:GT2 family glycosyltransferase